MIDSVRLNRELYVLIMATLLSCFFAFNSAQAARVTGLYTAQLLVAEQSVRVDPSLVSKAMRQVVVKVTGRTDAVNNTRIQAALADPNPYVQQFSYQNTTIPATTEDGREVLTQRLNIKFNHQLINEVLAEAGIRPLGATRPGLLVWLVEERHGKREFIGADEDPVFKSMLARAEARGLPIFRPLMDLEDEQALPVSDAWGFFADSIRRASARYQADAILVGRIYRQRNGNWKSQWQIVWPQEVIGFDGSGKSLEDQLASAIENSSDRLFADFVGSSSGFEDGALMVISGVYGLDDYFQLTNYLKELPAIRAVMMHSLMGDQLTLSLKIDGSVKQVESSIGLNQRLTPQVSFPVSQPSYDGAFYKVPVDPALDSPSQFPAQTEGNIGGGASVEIMEGAEVGEGVEVVEGAEMPITDQTGVAGLENNSLIDEDTKPATVVIRRPTTVLNYRWQE